MINQPIQWYPGHMAKAKRLLQQHLRVIDLVVEVLDARIPDSSRNPELDALCASKLRMIVLNKKDLADEGCTQRWLDFYANKGVVAIATDARKEGDVKRLLSAIRKASEPLVQRYKARGVNKTVRVMVVGIPNVGKSSLINRIAKGKPAAVGDRPGVTRGTQWVRLAKGIELMDTPGLLWPKLDQRGQAQHIAYIRSIRDEVIEVEALCGLLLEELHGINPQKIQAVYGPWAGDGERMLYALCEHKRYLVNGEPDVQRGAKAVLDAFRSGGLGRYTLERPEDAACD